MEIRLWEATTGSERVTKLEDMSPCFGYRGRIINARESTLKFSPNGKLLCVPAYFPEEKKCKCVVLDTKNLEPLCLMAYGSMCYYMYCIFPCFTSCSSKFVMLSVEHENNYYDLEKYKYLYFAIPPTMESLKELCKFAILKYVPVPMLEKLLLPNDLITFLGGHMTSSNGERKHCMVM